MRLVLNIASVAVALAIIVTALYVMSLVRGVAYVDHVVAENVPVSGAWLEITPPHPLKTTGRAQYLSVGVKGAAPPPKRIGGLDPHGENRDRVELLDGTSATPEIQLVDESGQAYDLRAEMDDYAGKGFALRADAGALPSSTPARAFTVVRIRSDKPILISKVTWHCRAGARR